eukprot:scaffold87052_cov81-Phaeocystis_antarctica.AAC.3
MSPSGVSSRGTAHARRRRSSSAYARVRSAVPLGWRGALVLRTHVGQRAPKQNRAASRRGMMVRLPKMGSVVRSAPSPGAATLPLVSV